MSRIVTKATSMKKIAVLGGGQVGASVAKILTDDGNDITLVDNNASVLEDLQEDNDIKTIQGNASSPSILNQVELSDCDILIATTASDEVNLVSCHLAKKIFNVPNVIARLRNAEYREETSNFNLDLFSIDSKLFLKAIELVRFPLCATPIPPALVSAKKGCMFLNILFPVVLYLLWPIA